MNTTQELRRKYFTESHPYQRFEQEVRAAIRRGDLVLDVGCGRAAPLLRRLTDTDAALLTGIDPAIPEKLVGRPALLPGTLVTTPFLSESRNLVISRSVMEHLYSPRHEYREIARVLVRGGRFLFLTPNLWDYASLIAWITPNRWHPWIVEHTEGRDEADTFPTFYRANTAHRIRKLARTSGLAVERLEYWGQAPTYLQRWPLLFAAGTLYEKVIAAKWPWLRGWIFGELRKAGNTNC